MNAHAYCLLVDTSLCGAAVGLASYSIGTQAEAKFLGMKFHREVLGSASHLGGLAGRVLAEAGLGFSDLSGALVSLGPGSFTGLRVGLSFVYGLQCGAAGALKVAGCSSLLQFARRQARVDRLQRGQDKQISAFYLPGTRDQGFVALASDAGDGDGVDWRSQEKWGDYQADWPGVVRVDAKLPIPPLENGCYHVVLPWPLAEENLGKQGLAPRCWEPGEVVSEAMYGMFEWFSASGWAAFRDDFLEPRYLRQSTAEEQSAKSGAKEV